MEQIYSFFRKKTIINCGGQLIDITKPVVMGIINITPDSFYRNSRYCDENAIITRVEQIINEGGKIVDIGAYSSRPDAKDISVGEEIRRLQFALSIIKKHFPELVLSIDTFRSEVINQVYDKYGAFIVNDISAGCLDPKMFDAVAKLRLPYIAMHMKGNPQTMAHETHYDNLLHDIFVYFADKIERLINAGVNDIIIDPGYGFSKNIEQNYELLNRLDEFKIFELPILVGLSRKRMVYQVLGINVDEALNGTSVLNTIALQKGADILRVHDVKAAVECVKIINCFTLI
jgi:dihydropteroate synthase